jgi:pantoate--beta-alanine ligase
VKVVRTVAAVRDLLDAERRAGRTIGFVPTMGYFHEGHRSLMRRARNESDVVVVSLFVNPAQFNDQSDLAVYPRDEARDFGIASEEGVDVMFAPPVEEIYRVGFSTTVTVSGVSEPMEGEARGPSHFAGVATVVSKLFNIVDPTTAFFGQKDAQQSLVVRRMVRDLDLRVRVEVCPTVREPDGLAMSSRNVRLDPAARQQARALSAALFAAEHTVAAGARDATAIVAAAQAVLDQNSVIPEYLRLVSVDTLQEIDTLGSDALLAVAARVGGIRLIDNTILTAG